MPILLFSIAASLEGFFFGSGKAAVVAAVVMIILLGFAWALYSMDRRLNELEKECGMQPKKDEKRT